MSNSILIIDDDPELIRLVGGHMQNLGYTIDSAEDGEAGLIKALKNEYTLVIVDVQLPKIRGFEICKRLRVERENLPILMLTGNSEEIDKVLGLELGADDYLTKPFSLRELAARISAILRRTKDRSNTTTQDKETLTFGDLRIDCKTREVFVKGNPISLSPSEYNLLTFMAKHPGQSFPRDEITEKIWGYTVAGYDQVVTTTLSRLRTKIEPDPENPIYIKTVRGFGYRFAKYEDFEK